MEIRTIWQQGQYPSFNLELASEAGRDAFLVLKGCQLKDGPNGPFVSVPSKKNESTGKYWNHAYLADKFAAIVLSKAQESQPQAAPKAAPARQEQRSNSGGFADMDSDIPFNNPMKSRAFCLSV